jgi:hypothetical protein
MFKGIFPVHNSWTQPSTPQTVHKWKTIINYFWLNWYFIDTISCWKLGLYVEIGYFEATTSVW